MSRTFVIEPAQAGDRDAILAVMRPWNMHHVPSPEMEELDLDTFYVARVDGRIVGAAGYKVLSQTRAKTTLLGVLPAHSQLGIGAALQRKRLEAMHRIGVKKVVTNADRPATIRWYKERFGYVEVGTLKKVSEFGDPAADAWTTLELDLERYMRESDREAVARAYLQRHEPHPLAPYPPLLVGACLSAVSAASSKGLALDEIIADAVRLYDAGARLVTVRGLPMIEPATSERIFRGIRRERPLLLCGIGTDGDLERHAEVLALSDGGKPDFLGFPLTLSSIAGPQQAQLDALVRLAGTMGAHDVRPQFIVGDTGMISVVKLLERQGVVGGRKLFNFELGRLGTTPATIGNLATLITALPDDSVWMATGAGIFCGPMSMAAIAAGGGVYLGTDESTDNAPTEDRATSVERVRQVVRIANELERRVATDAEAREMLGLGPARASDHA